MTFKPPESFSIADYFLFDRLREGQGDRVAIRTDERLWTYTEVAERALHWQGLLFELGVQPEQRVLLAAPDGIDFVAALFGALRLGAVAVFANPELKRDSCAYFLEYTRAAVALIGPNGRDEWGAAAGEANHLPHLLVTGDNLDSHLALAPKDRPAFASHRDDAAIWLFSGGTTGRPKAVVQTHRSFANTTECYAKGVLGIREDDITLSVPKLFFGYATGSNLFFPFSVGASCVLFPERCTPDRIFDEIERHRPSILINVPTMIQKLLGHETAAQRDLSCLRFATSAGEALPPELYERWCAQWDVEILDGLGTAEMWHVFLTNAPGDVEPGTLGRVVPGFEVKLCNDDGEEVAAGETGWLWVRGGSRAIGYWQQQETESAFRGEWYVSGDMLRQRSDGRYVYCGRGDDMLKVAGKWLAPGEVENCLLKHPAVKEAAVVGATDPHGLVKPWAFVIPTEGDSEADAAALQEFVREHLEAYKAPREIVVQPTLPRTHLGKIDRGKLRSQAEAEMAAG